jgi:hypothetical protein
MEYRYGSHTVYKIQYHFVFVTKYRYRVLKGDVGLNEKGTDLFEKINLSPFHFWLALKDFKASNADFTDHLVARLNESCGCHYTVTFEKKPLNRRFSKNWNDSPTSGKKRQIYSRAISSLPNQLGSNLFMMT